MNIELPPPLPCPAGGKPAVVDTTQLPHQLACPLSKSQVIENPPNILPNTCGVSGYHGFKSFDRTQGKRALKKVGWNRTIKRWSTFCTGPGSPYSTAVINWPNKECPLCYLKRHKPGHRRTIKDIVLNLLPLEMDFSRAKLPFRLSVVWKAYIENNLLGL